MFSWDTAKAISNFEKHGVSFEEAATVFADENAFDLDDRNHSQIEKRYLRFGLSISARTLAVVYTRRTRNGEETIRIISARRASRQERKIFFG